MSTPTVASGDVRPLSLPARFFGIITSPRDTYQAVVAHPKWFGMLALVTLAITFLVGGYMSTPVGQQAWLEASAAGATDQQYEGMLRVAKYVGYITAVWMLVFIPIITVVVSGVLYAGFNAFGGDATFKQVLAVNVHAGVISVLAQLFTVPVNYGRAKMTSATNLVALLPMVDEKSFLGRLMATIDLFLIWWVLVLAIGLGVLYRRRTQPIAMALFGVYAVIALAAAAVMYRMGGA